MTEGLTLAKLVTMKLLLKAADVPSNGPLVVSAMWFGRPPRRKRRHVVKPLALWREKLARMEHRAQERRWREKPDVRTRYDAMRQSLKAGEVVSFMGFRMVASNPL